MVHISLVAAISKMKVWSTWTIWRRWWTVWLVLMARVSGGAIGDGGTWQFREVFHLFRDSEVTNQKKGKPTLCRIAVWRLVKPWLHLEWQEDPEISSVVPQGNLPVFHPCSAATLLLCTAELCTLFGQQDTFQSLKCRGIRDTLGQWAPQLVRG